MDSTRDRFAALLDAHRGIVFKVANAYCRDPHDRQDLAQEIAAQLWRSFPGFDPARAAFTTWAYRIALNVAISQLRSTTAQAPAVPLEDRHDAHDALQVEDVSERHAEDARLQMLHAVIARQPPLDRALLLLWLDECSQREIGEVLGISESNVSTKLHRLKRHIREQMTGHGAL